METKFIWMLGGYWCYFGNLLQLGFRFGFFLAGDSERKLRAQCVCVCVRWHFYYAIKLEQRADFDFSPHDLSPLCRPQKAFYVNVHESYHIPIQHFKRMDANESYILVY